MSIGIYLFPILGLAIIIVSTLIFLASRYVRCPSDKILVKYGRVGGGRSAECIHGGGTFVWPLIQDFKFLDLTPMTIGIPLQKALSFQNIRINVPSTFTVGISINPGTMVNAAERLLNLKKSEIEEMAKEIIFGQLRLTVASLTIEQINQDRERFLEAIRKNVEPELNKIGLYLINVNITDITDESDYIESIGKKAAAEAINQAKIDVAEQAKLGSIGEAEAVREQEIKVAENFAQAEKGKKKAEADQRIYVQKQESEAVQGENLARAEIATSNAALAMREAEARKDGEVADRQADVQIQKAQYSAELERLRATEIVKEEILKQQVEIAAEAEAEKIRRIARGDAEKIRVIAKGDADAILMKYEAEAEGIRKVLKSKGEGYHEIMQSCDGDAKSAATFLMIEKINEIVGAQTEAIKNLKIDKITVWDSGSADGSSSTANFMSNFIKSLPALHDIASMAGLDLPAYLGEVKRDEKKPPVSNGGGGHASGSGAKKGQPATK